MSRYRHKTFHRSGNPKFAEVVDALNALGRDLNAHGSIDPIKTVETIDGCQHVFDAWESPFAHPWRVYRPRVDIAKVNVAGGVVNTGAALVTVEGLTNITPVDGLRIWLSVKYYNNPATPSEIALGSGTGDWPLNDYECDHVPAGIDPTVLPSAGWNLTIVPVAEIDGEILRQYQYSDVLLPYGRTYTMDRVFDHKWGGSMFQHITGCDTIVRGILIATAAPVIEDVFDTGDCPE